MSFHIHSSALPHVSLSLSLSLSLSFQLLLDSLLVCMSPLQLRTMFLLMSAFFCRAQVNLWSIMMTSYMCWGPIGSLMNMSKRALPLLLTTCIEQSTPRLQTCALASLLPCPFRLDFEPPPHHEHTHTHTHTHRCARIHQLTSHHLQQYQCMSFSCS